MKETLNYLFAHNILTQDEAKSILKNIGTGLYSESEIASFLTVYLMREITPQELAGFREALLDLCVQIDLSEFNTIDVCGTGGDGKNTFNISTLSAFVLAGAGVKVVKHGNNGVSSPSGSSNMFEKLGYRFSNENDKLRRELDEANLCYMHAPLFHPAMKYVAPVRKALKVKTFFNILGPMVNPSRPKNQLIGVYSESTMDLYHGVFKDTEINYSIVHSNDGYDEISLTSSVKVTGKNGKKELSPKDFSMPVYKQEDLHGGDTIKRSFEIFKQIIEGKGTQAQNDVVIANAALAMQCYDESKSLDRCVEECRQSITDGKALKVMNKLIELNA